MRCYFGRGRDSFGCTACNLPARNSTTLLATAEDIPNPAWLHGGIPSAGQQRFGAGLLGRHAFVAFPSAVSKRSWNLVFAPELASGHYALEQQERLVVDTRLNPGAK